jgi:uncharacterized protein (DUF849 family)
MLQAALNGPFTKADHPALPVSLVELGEDAVACVEAGAETFHVHPRDDEGKESLEAAVVDRVAGTLSDRCGAPVGVTTGAWIEPDVKARIRLVRRWREPASATVNLSEEGAIDIMRTLLEAGIGVEAGVWTPADARRLVESGLGAHVLRVCVEPVDLPARGAVEYADQIHALLDAGGVTPSRLQHGDGESTWVLLTDAVSRGIDTRIGLEDTLQEADGETTSGNSALVRSAVRLGAGHR